MAVDKRGRKLPKGIRQRYNDFEGRFMYQGERLPCTWENGHRDAESNDRIKI